MDQLAFQAAFLQQGLAVCHHIIIVGQHTERLAGMPDHLGPRPSNLVKEGIVGIQDDAIGQA